MANQYTKASNKSIQNKSSSNRQSSGSNEQQRQAGMQSHKNDSKRD